MVCKKQEQCKFGKMCGWAEDEETLLTECVEFIERVLLTNEEYLKSCDTEQLAEWLQEHMDCSNCDCNKDLCYKGYDCCKLAFLEWLKQPHIQED